MSTEDNKNIVRRYQDAYNTGDFIALAEVVAADVLTPNIAPGMPPGLEAAKAEIGRRSRSTAATTIRPTSTKIL